MLSYCKCSKIETTFICERVFSLISGECKLTKTTNDTGYLHLKFKNQKIYFDDDTDESIIKSFKVSL